MNRNNRIRRSAAYLAAAIAAAMAAAAAPSAFAGGRRAAPAAAAPLVIAGDAEVQTLDFSGTMEGNSLQAMKQIGEGLYKNGPNGAPVPALAASAIKSADGTILTYTIADARWSDGSPVTAHDFVYAWRRLADPANTADYAFLVEAGGILNAHAVITGELPSEQLGVSAPDDRTLVVTLERPVPFIESLFAFVPFFPLKQSFVETQGSRFGMSPGAVLSNGPFIVTAYEPNSTVVEFARNPAYYRADEVRLPGLVLQAVKELQQGALSYQSGELDYIRLSGEQIDLFRNDPDFRSEPGGRIYFVWPNHRKPALQNRNLRLALALSVDKTTLVKNILRDGSLEANYFVPRGLGFDPAGRDYRDTTRSDYLSPDKAAARRYWEQAKAELGVQTLNLEFVVDDLETETNVAQFVQAQFQDTLPGLTVTINRMPKKARTEQTSAGNFDLYLGRWGPDYPDPATFLDLWVSYAHTMPHFWNSAAYDAAIQRASSGEVARDPDARYRELQRAEAILAEEAAVIPLFQSAVAFLIKPNVKDVEFHFVYGGNDYTHAVKE